MRRHTPPHDVQLMTQRLAPLALLASLVACGSETSAPSSSPATEATTPDAGTPAAATGCSAGKTDRPVEMGETYAAFCTASGGAENTYIVTAPNDVTGGLLEVGLVNVKGDALEITIHELEANGEVVKGHRTDVDASLGVYTTVKPGARYRITVTHWSKFDRPTTTYDLALAYTKIDDGHEPNDTLTTATPIQKDTDVKGVVAIGLSDLPNQQTEETEDWFSVDLAGGSATFTLTNPAPPLEPMWLRVFDADGKLIARKNSQGIETKLEIVDSIPGAGSYKVRVSYYGLSFTAFRGDEPRAPASLLQRYTLRVTQ